MGFITKQFVNRGLGIRSRSYTPVPIDASADYPADSWSKRNKVVVQIIARRRYGEMQMLYLTLPETEKIAETIVRVCGADVRTRLAVELLKTMTDAELLRALATDLKGRVRSTLPAT